MATTPQEQATEIVVAMIEKGLIFPTFGSNGSSTDAYARDIAKAYRIMFKAASNPEESD